ncbi:hypothetical protein BDU57DRAFT_542587 [Ampelomyces quisqualis]|uniref:Uncharacterized protein n=1 Tax=Ampelomyces quisqualis TaxID=50730 RepID=A0A6A5QAY3_AMPQU|nr:hypothetical protein BDU57DRAFT_542587 [Ampelomyces quisqualis]
MRQFVDRLIKNRAEEEIGDNQVVHDNSYAVTVGESPPDRGDNIVYSKDHRPAPEDCPLEVGAQSALKPLLPFMGDEVHRKGYGVQISCLSTYMRDSNQEKAPLPRYAPTGLVRVEAYHYGACELDAFVFGLAQKAGMEVQWPEGRCHEAALMELEQCGLPIDGLASAGEFGPQRCM